MLLNIRFIKNFKLNFECLEIKYTYILSQTIKPNMRYLHKIISFFVFLFFCAGSFATDDSQVVLVDWYSAESIKRLSRSKHKEDFFYLASQFQNQMDGLTCGPTTGAIVLNALRIRTAKNIPKTTFNNRYRKYLPKAYDPRVLRYTPQSFMNKQAQKIKSLIQLYGKPIGKKKDFGLQLRQLHNIFLSHGVKSTLRVVNKELSDQKIQQELISNLKNQGDYVVVNYHRPTLGQKGGGHISPLGAYDKKTNSFLVMDVNTSRYNWVWLNAEDLIKAMRTLDTIENRGYLLITE